MEKCLRFTFGVILAIIFPKFLLTTSEEEQIGHVTTYPYLANNSVINVTFQIGATAFLNCKAKNLGDTSISWIRRDNFYILTSGTFRYTKDERYKILHVEHSEDWTLQIKYVQLRDSGLYECQVSTETGIVSSFIKMTVIAAEAIILGSKDYHAELGTTIKLVCLIEKSYVPPQYVYWYHNRSLINYNSDESDVSVETVTGDKTKSTLVINVAKYTHSGNYTCDAPNILADSTNVYISEGDKTAAISRKNSGMSSHMYLQRMILVLSVFGLFG